jgi:hypothetical protein
LPEKEKNNAEIKNAEEQNAGINFTTSSFHHAQMRKCTNAQLDDNCTTNLSRILPETHLLSQLRSTARSALWSSCRG